MEVKQVYALVNNATKEITGLSEILQEDLTGVVELGDALFNANAVDKYVKALVNHIGKVIFVNRVYRGGAPSVLMDGWEYGSVLEKIAMDLPVATENESWELVSGTSYDVNVFTAPAVNAKFFNKMVTFEIPISITEKQVKQSFSNATQLNAFLSMIYAAVDNSMTIKIDSLIMRTINNMTAETLYDEYNDGAYDTKSGVRAINLLKKYNEHFDTTLTANDCLSTPEFIRYASYQMSLYIDRLAKMSTLFNVGGKERFTPIDKLHFVLLSEFAKASDIYLQSDVFHDEKVSLPKYESVPYWQGSGVDYSFNAISSINVKSSGNHTVTASGILGVMFDRDALGVCNIDRRTTSNYNPKAEFFNNWFKFDAQYFNDLNENFIVFFVA